jgi:hypothetical protein
MPPLSLMAGVILTKASCWKLTEKYPLPIDLLKIFLEDFLVGNVQFL